MLETKCVGDNFEMLVTVLTVFVTNILYFLTLASGTNIYTALFQVLSLNPANEPVSP